MSPTKKNRRCPNGTRRNKKTGLCEPINASPAVVTLSQVPLVPVSHIVDINNESKISPILQDDQPNIDIIKIPSPKVGRESEPEKRVPSLSTLITIDTQKIKPTKSRCPNGTRKNKKTGLCEKISDDLSTSPNAIPVTEVLTTKTRRCPPGYRKNPKTGICIPLQDKTIEPGVIPIPEKESDEVVRQIQNPTLEKQISLQPVSTGIEISENPQEEAPQQQEEKIIEVVEPVFMNNDELFQIEKNEYEIEQKSPNSEYNFLYPNLNDPMFNTKIADRKEFYDTQYDGDISVGIKEKANKMCNVKFELMPHQLFVKNFMSFQTPYNGLLLYHGLGSGKTCSAIGIAEEMRQYMKQVGIKQRIIVVASPNVQGNFRMQLFDERKLRKIPNPNQIQGLMGSEEDIWDIHSCVGNSLLKEINPANLKGVSREKVISQINTIINMYYIFMGYGQFANYINDSISISSPERFTEKERIEYETRSIRRIFNNRLVIIDEVHNIRLSDENNNKKTAALLMKVAKHSDNMRLLLLSATPMFNSYKEIIWITNLLNINDKRSTIDAGSVFDKDGNYKAGDEQGRTESGEALLKRKLTGYVSYVRGENPFIFPYRIYPHLFAKENTFENEQNTYPSQQMNGMTIEDKIKYVRVYLNTCGIYQEKVYNTIIDSMRRRDYSYQTSLGDIRELPSFENMESFGYTLLQTPIESLNMVYPNPDIEKMIANKTKTDDVMDSYTNAISKSIGNEGLMNVMDFNDDTKPAPMKHNFKYKSNIESMYGRIFSPDLISLYSAKIANICNIIKKSKGVIVIYSQYIHGGIIPVALALEEMGFTRYCSNMSYDKNLFRNRGSEQVDAITMKPRSEVVQADFQPAKYMMITGDKSYSPSNTEDIKYSTQVDNKNGEKVKVILVSKAGSEGLDFKNIRQVHILEPWYNMNRIEQIIGRGVRNLSHCDLPFEERNVEIYLHSTILPSKKNEETVDLYVYRFAEKKAIQIGKVSRTLKETSVDCILNISQTNFTAAKLGEIAENENIEMKLSSGKTIEFKVGDEPYSSLCDYMETCVHTCNPSIIPKGDNKDTYQSYYANTNNENILKKIGNLYREKSFYKRDELVKEINHIRPYPIEQIFYALTFLIQNKNEYLVDKYGRIGNLINKDDYYVFQPVEITDQNISIYERVVPVDYKRRDILLEVPTSFDEPITSDTSKTTEATLTSSSEDIILKKMMSQLNTVFSPTTQTIGSGEKNWYKHANHVIESIGEQYSIEMDKLKEYVIYHMLDLTMFEDKLALLKYLLLPSRVQMDSDIETNLIPLCMKYFDKKLMMVADKYGVYLTKDNVSKLYVRDDFFSDWVEADADDYNYIKDILKERFVVPVKKINTNIIGFVNMFKNKDMVFKIKDVRKKRNNKGARCGDSTTRMDVVKALNTLLGDNTNNQYGTVFHIGLCVLVEMILRHYSDIKKDGKMYYFDPEETFINNITELGIEG
jgi:hypothetical protein